MENSLILQEMETGNFVQFNAGKLFGLGRTQLNLENIIVSGRGIGEKIFLRNIKRLIIDGEKIIQSILGEFNMWLRRDIKRLILGILDLKIFVRDAIIRTLRVFYIMASEGLNVL